MNPTTYPAEILIAQWGIEMALAAEAQAEADARMKDAEAVMKLLRSRGYRLRSGEWTKD